MTMKTIPLLLLTFLLAACNLPTSTPTFPPEPTISWTVYPTLATTPSFTPTASGVPPLAPTLRPLGTPETSAPGLVVRGRVTLNGVGLAGVSILRRYASYPGEVVAVTGADGYYQSAFMGIPGDEMVGILPELAGYIFDPPFYYWRHYYGYEESACNFAALPTP